MTLVINTIDEAQEKALITILEGLHIPYVQRQTIEEYNKNSKNDGKKVTTDIS